jgi:hypothetical protein
MLAVERDTPCTFMFILLVVVHGKGYTLHVHTVSDGKGYNLHVHIAGDGKGPQRYTVHVHTAGGGAWKGILFAYC